LETKLDKVRSAKYRKRLSWVPWVELLIGLFRLHIWYAIENDNFFTVPFSAAIVSAIGAQD